MRHRKSGRKLGRTSAHRKAMLRNTACNLFLTAQGDDERPLRITTTIPKAKEVRRLAERCVTLAKKALAQHDGEGTPRVWGSHPVRRLKTLLGRRDAIACLLEDIAPLYTDRQGGYTRILRLAARRLGDGADLCYLEMVTEPVEAAIPSGPAEPVAPRRATTPVADGDEPEEAADDAEAEEAEATEDAAAADGDDAPADEAPADAEEKQDE